MLIAVVQQLHFNYDLYGMSADEIMTLLPTELARATSSDESDRIEGRA